MTDPTKRSIEEMATSLARSEAQLASGKTVPMAPAMKRLRDSITQLEARQHDDQHWHEATPGR